MSFDTVAVEDHDQVRIIRLDREDKKNAFNARQARDFHDALKEAGEDENVLVIVVTGTGTAFSAGADMNTFAGNDGGDPNDIVLIGNLDKVIRSVEKPLLAAVKELCDFL